MFWVYSFYGAVLTRGQELTTVILATLFFTGVFLTCIYSGLKQIKEFEESIYLNLKDLFVWLSYIIVLLPFCWHQLTSLLKGDQINHAIASKKHALSFFFKIADKLDFIDFISFKDILYIIDLISVIILSIIIFLLYKLVKDSYKKKKYHTVLIFTGFIFIITRVILILNGGAGSPHPQFRLFPVWLTSSLFTSSSFSFKMPSFIMLVSCMWIAQRIIHQKLPFWVSWLFGLTIGTIPIFWYTGTIVEPSIYTAVAFTIFVLTIYRWDNNDTYPLYRWLIIIVIIFLMRLSAVVGFISLILLGIILFFRDNNTKLKLFPLVLPVLVFLPFFLQSIIMGTATTHFTTQDNSIVYSLNQFIKNINSGLLLKVVHRDLSIPWTILLIVGFIPFNKKKISNLLILILFFSGSIFMFTILEGFGAVGSERYQAEYLVPFAVLGLYRIVVNFHQSHRLTYFAGLICICLLVFNIFSYSKLNKLPLKKYNGKNEVNYPALVTSEIYNYKDAFKYIKRNSYAGNFFVFGSQSGILPKIIAGFKTQDIIKLNAIEEHLPYRPSGFSVSDINTIDKKVKLLIVEDIGRQKDKLTLDLVALAWQIDTIFVNTKTNSVLYAMVRR